MLPKINVINYALPGTIFKSIIFNLLSSVIKIKYATFKIGSGEGGTFHMRLDTTHEFRETQKGDTSKKGCMVRRMDKDNSDVG